LARPDYAARPWIASNADTSEVLYINAIDDAWTSRGSRQERSVDDATTERLGDYLTSLPRSGNDLAIVGAASPDIGGIRLTAGSDLCNAHLQTVGVSRAILCLASQNQREYSME
jgi:hypothetical protein